MLSSEPILPPPSAAPLIDAELLERISRRDLDASAARAAEGQFYSRHVRYLYAVLVRRAQRPLALSGREVEDLVQEAFYRAFARAHTFSAGDAFDEESLTRRTRAWLGRIAQNLLADWLKDAHEVAATPFLESVVQEELEAPPSSRSPKVVLMRQALDTLTERERDIVRVSALYYRPGEEHQRLPNDASAELATRWGTSNENVRAIRSRALKKLREYFEAQAGKTLEDA